MYTRLGSTVCHKVYAICIYLYIRQHRKSNNWRTTNKMSFNYERRRTIYYIYIYGIVTLHEVIHLFESRSLIKIYLECFFFCFSLSFLFLSFLFLFSFFSFFFFFFIGVVCLHFIDDLSFIRSRRDI